MASSRSCWPKVAPRRPRVNPVQTTWQGAALAAIHTCSIALSMALRDAIRLFVSYSWTAYCVVCETYCPGVGTPRTPRGGDVPMGHFVTAVSGPAAWRSRQAAASATGTTRTTGTTTWDFGVSGPSRPARSVSNPSHLRMGGATLMSASAELARLDSSQRPRSGLDQ